jgi:hypothetical protein
MLIPWIILSIQPPVQPSKLSESYRKLGVDSARRGYHDEIRPGGAAVGGRAARARKSRLAFAPGARDPAASRA